MSGEIENKIFEIVSDCVGKIPNDTAYDLQEAGMMDSLAMMNIMASLEDEFDVEFDPKDIHRGNFLNIDTMRELVQKYI